MGKIMISSCIACGGFAIKCPRSDLILVEVSIKIVLMFVVTLVVYEAF